MNVTDRQILWKRKHLIIPMTQARFGGSTGLTLTQHTGAVYGVDFSAAGATHECAVPLPTDVNPGFPLGFTVLFTGKGTLLTSVTWVVLAVLRKNNGVAFSTTATGALDTLIGATTVASGYAGKFLMSRRGLRNANFATRAEIMAGTALQYSIQLSAASGIAVGHEATLLGLELDYMPMKTRYPHSELDGPTDDAIS